MFPARERFFAPFEVYLCCLSASVSFGRRTRFCTVVRRNPAKPGKRLLRRNRALRVHGETKTPRRFATYIFSKRLFGTMRRDGLVPNAYFRRRREISGRYHLPRDAVRLRGEITTGEKKMAKRSQNAPVRPGGNYFARRL